ncbi:hemicentin-2 [Manduca sexta]|uniref:hemicentin-2 n=1 Tax=Manduca sexta TaxID=7130 RepID=UPI00188EBA5D|nr:hemicentin-2 [Manduca sexta]
MGTKLLILSILLQISYVFTIIENCPNEERGSLAFIIEDASSMAVDIQQVKAGIDGVFDAVLKSKSSPIENFILVSFDDSDARTAILTRDRVEFKQALSNIHADGVAGSKYSLSGIEHALEKSLPFSYLYVFTDAPAKDSLKYELIKRLAQMKSSQISFILTGKHNYEQDPDYSVYYTLARATSGLVMHVDKPDVSEIMSFIGEKAEYCSSVIYNGALQPGYGQEVKFNIEEHQTDVKISAFGNRPKLEAVNNNQNVKQETEVRIDTELMIVVNLLTNEPGEYTAVMGSESATKVNIDAVKPIGFVHGFSSIKPSSVEDTATLPKSGVKSYLAVKLHQYSANVKLSKIKLLDLDGNVTLEYPVEVTDEKGGLYVTDLIDVPKDMFRIMVVGYDVNSNAIISKMGRTPIEATQ